MRRLTIFALCVVTTSYALAAREPRIVQDVKPLPVALDNNFEFRKTKLYSLPGIAQRGREKAGKNGQGASASKTRSVVQDASINFESEYRLHGAVTALDRRQRNGDYFDFFWRAKRSANLTIRLEYRQEKLRAKVQAQELSYANVDGTNKSEFKVVGDEFYDEGRVIAWRCLMIENGSIVAENRSYMWE